MTETIQHSGDFGPLLEIAQPDLYERNGFRLAELPVDSSVRDFSKRQQMIEMAGKTGMELPAGPARIFPLEQGKDAHVVREAIHRLRDPQSRLVHEFFWFWPHTLGQSRTDEAMTALARGDNESASAIWHQQESNLSESHVSTHNLAILRHLSALEWEKVGAIRELTDEEKEQVELCWESAFRRWKLLLEHEAFWSRLTARIHDLNDPRLTAGTARNMRSTLPLALLSINASLAVHAGERGNAAEAQRQVRILREWEKRADDKEGELPPLADQALRRALEPMRARLKHLCKAANDEAQAAPEHADQPTRRMLEQARPLLAVVDCVLPKGHPTYDALHDEVALAALGCMILYGNKTEDWSTTGELVEQILPLAVSESARNRVQKNLKIFQDNRALELCWFCQQAQGDEKHAITVKMHGEVQRLYTRITWRHGSCKVPRCNSCKAVHDKRDWLGFAIFALCVLILGTGIGALATFSDENYGTGIICGLVCASAIWSMIAVILRWPKGVKKRSEYNQHPTIKELLGKGWAFGESPTTQ